MKIETYSHFTMDALGGKQTASNVLHKGVLLLEYFNLTYWLSAGTLLGIHRDNKLIDHDTDIDVELHGPINGNKLIDLFRANGFELIRTITIGNRPYQIAFIHLGDNIIFDIYLYYTEDDRIINLNDQGKLWYPSSMLSNMGNIDFDGHTYKAPEPDWYCNFRYGSDWRIPKVSKGDWQNDAENLI